MGNAPLLRAQSEPMQAVRERAVQTGALVLIAAILGAAALYWLSPVLIPFVLALFVWLGARPLIQWLERQLRLPRGLAVLAALGLAIATGVLLAALVSGSLVRLAQDAPQYQERSRALIERGLEAVPEALRAPLLEQFELRPLLERTAGRVAPLIIGSANAILGIVSQFFLVLVFVLFLLLGEDRRPAAGIRGEVERRIQRYLGVKSALSALTGILTWIALAALGVDLALVFGLLAFLLNFIPAIGSIVAVLLPLPMVAFMPEVSGFTVLLALGIPGAIQLVLGNVVEPKMLGESLGLHPVAVLLALIFWGTLWGIAGMLLAAPITAVACILMERSELTRPIAGLLAGRMPDSPDPVPAQSAEAAAAVEETNAHA
jgi:AI-2 transport protein TqsA